jgi:uncharacterized SAM-binding protein YcdF (DUF218 family)
MNVSASTPSRNQHTGLARAWLALAGAILSIDAIVLMVMGLLNFGVILPLALGIAALLLAWQWKAVARWRAHSKRNRRIWLAGWTLLWLWLVTVALFFWGVHTRIGSMAPYHAGAKAIIILGSGTPHCKPSPTLAARLDEGLVLARLSPAARVVVSGGQDFALHCTEADIMAGYLVAHGLGPARLIIEGRSTSTEENLRFSQQLLAEQGISKTDPVTLVTSDFHLMRAEGIARKVGFSAVGSAPAATPLYLRYNAWLREYFAMLSSRALGEF